MSFSYGDHAFWSVYITIENLDAKTRQFQKRPKLLLFDFISIIHKWSEDANNKNKNLEAKIYYIALKTILQYTYPSFLFIDFKEIRC